MTFGPTIKKYSEGSSQCVGAFFFSSHNNSVCSTITASSEFFEVLLSVLKLVKD